MKFLIFGDVVGKPGREAITRALPDLRAEYEPDSVIVNIENAAGGRGMSPSIMKEVEDWKAQVLTTGDHAWDTEASVEVLNNSKWPVIRPANYPEGVQGKGYHVFTNGAWRVAVINLQGQVFFKNDPLNPFLYLDELLKKKDIATANIRLVDFHVEASSEARGMSWHGDGRVSAIWGTHTHVPTADAQIMPEGTGYVTSLGFNGNHYSIIGVDKEEPLKGFLTQSPVKFKMDSTGPLEVSALFLEIDPVSGVTKNIANVRKILVE